MRCGATRVLSGLMLLLTPIGARAQPTESETKIWYRSGVGCPDDAAFVEGLARRNVAATVASAGDRIDFVVTLGASTEGFSGRLERQVGSGTVAMRSFEAESCAEVADALAVTLALSLTPALEEAPTPAVSPEVSEKAPQSGGPAAPPKPAPEPDRGPASRPAPDSGWSTGAQALGSSVLAPEWMLGLAVFAERDLFGTGWFAPTLRGSITGQRGNVVSEHGELTQTLLAARVEACPVRARAGTLTLRPCAGLDAGVLRADLSAENGTSASALWLAVPVHARASWRLHELLELEAQAGVVIPLRQHEIVLADRAEPLSRTNVVGLQAGAGIAYRWP